MYELLILFSFIVHPAWRFLLDQGRSMVFGNDALTHIWRLLYLLKDFSGLATQNRTQGNGRMFFSSFFGKPEGLVRFNRLGLFVSIILPLFPLFHFLLIFFSPFSQHMFGIGIGNFLFFF